LAQSGYIATPAIRFKVADSTTVLTPTGYDILYSFNNRLWYYDGSTWEQVQTGPESGGITNSAANTELPVTDSGGNLIGSGITTYINESEVTEYHFSFLAGADPLRFFYFPNTSFTDYVYMGAGYFDPNDNLFHDIGTTLNAPVAITLTDAAGSNTLPAIVETSIEEHIQTLRNNVKQLQFDISGAGGGTVTNVSSANSALSVSNPTTTPVLTVNSAPILTTARTINGVSFNGSANITLSGITYTFSSSAPSDIYTRWVDTGNGTARERPIRDYVNGAWTTYTDASDWWDVIGSIVSKGKPIYVLASGQSNAFASLYFPTASPSYTGDITVNQGVSYYNTTASAWQVLRSTTLGAPFSSTVGTTQEEIFAKLFFNEWHRSVRIVGTREPSIAMGGWESGGTQWTNLTNAITNSGNNYFDIFLWIHGEAGLGTSSFSTYKDSFYDFISRLRALSGANPKMKVLFKTHNLAIGVTTVSQTDGEGTARGLDYDNDLNTAFVKVFDALESKVGGPDLYHNTTSEHEVIGQAMYARYKTMGGFDKGMVQSVINTYSGNLITNRTVAQQNVDASDNQHQSVTVNGTGTFATSYGFGGSNSTTFPTKIVAKGQGGFARADIEFWANGAGSTATVSDLATRINSDGTQFAKPVNTALHSMITSTANNSGDAALTFNHASTVLPTSTWGRTGIVARATGAFSQANLYFFGGTTSPSTANLVTDTRLFLNTSTSAVSLTLGNNATPIATLGAVQPALSGAALLPALRINAGAHTAGNTGEKIDWYLNGNRTVQLNTGSYSLQRFAFIDNPTLGFVGSSTVTEVAGLTVTAPVAGTNAAFTNDYGIYVPTRNVGSGTVLSYGGYFVAQTGATTNYALGFSGGLNASGTTSPIYLNGSVGTSGQVLTSAGAGATPTWTTPSGGISGLTTNRIPYATSSTTLGDDSGFTFNTTGDIVTMGGLILATTPTNNNSPTQILSRNGSTGVVEYTSPSYFNSLVYSGTADSYTDAGRLKVTNTSVSSRFFESTMGSGSQTLTADASSSVSIFDTSTIPNNSTVVLTITLTYVKSDGSEAAGYEVISVWRKNNSGTLVKVGDSSQIGSDDAAGTITLTTTNSGGTIQSNVTTSGGSGTFHYQVFCDNKVYSY